MARSALSALTLLAGPGSFVTSELAEQSAGAATLRPGGETTSMPGEVLVDTNVVVYAYDPRDSSKQAKALSTLDHLVRTGVGRLSTQVLGEFFVTATQKLDPPLTAAEGYEQVEALAIAWPILSIAPLVPLEAARGVRDHRLPYWDAQLWATARLNQVPTVLTEDEDLADRTLEGVRFVNPFSSAFSLASLR